jgi:hypothetical protein
MLNIGIKLLLTGRNRPTLAEDVNCRCQEQLADLAAE